MRVRPKTTKIDCLIIVDESPCDALYKKNKPITDKRVMDIKRY
jgi:hypothetical protein